MNINFICQVRVCFAPQLTHICLAAQYSTNTAPLYWDFLENGEIVFLMSTYCVLPLQQTVINIYLLATQEP